MLCIGRSYWPRVPDDATLSDFQSDDRRLEEDTDDAGDGEETPQPVYAWGSYRCSACDSAVPRVWNQEGTYVCPACKRW